MSAFEREIAVFLRCVSPFETVGDSVSVKGFGDTKERILSAVRQADDLSFVDTVSCPIRFVSMPFCTFC